MSIRFKLTFVAVAVILVANAILSFVTLQYLSRVWLREVQTRVQRNLNSARAAYDNQVKIVAAFLEAAARDRMLATALAQRGRAELQAVLRQLHAGRRMDFLALLDDDGRVIGRALSQRSGDDLSNDPLVARAIRERRPVLGTTIHSQAQLLAEGQDLATRARFVLVPTPAARPSREKVCLDGMVAAAAVPVLDDRGHVRAILYGGDLLNRRYEVVDAVKEQVFLEEVYQDKPVGTVTIFQRDLRISTNVTMEDGSRAVGTRMSAAVCEEVLDRGRPWAGTAFVVNDWYITAYEPIRDPLGRVIGALYVGLLEAPFTHQRNVISAVFLSLVVATTLASLSLLFIANHWVLQPVVHIVAMAQRVISGDLSARVGIRPPGEIGVLCRAIDSMAVAVAEREELLEQAARQQIVRSEQLASVGRLAAGVAHEINNPLTGVLAFADLLREKENMDEQDVEDLNVIIRETKRAREIVRGLLDYARETPSVKAHLDLNEVIRQTIMLLGKREAFQNIYIVEDLSPDLPRVDGDKNQLQQVLMNLCLNGCEAMPDGGTLQIATSAADDKVIVKVTDTGMGIKNDHLGRIFEPFFTTKPVGKGTGLGLSVSYGIVEQHGGTLAVESQEGNGSTFTITFPALPSEPPASDQPASEQAVNV